MTLPLPASLRAAADGPPLEAATGLVTAHGTRLAREDFAASSITAPGRPPSTGKPPPARWTPANFPAQAENSECPA